MLFSRRLSPGRQESKTQDQKRFRLLTYFVGTSLIVVVGITAMMAFLFNSRVEGGVDQRMTEQGGLDAGHVAYMFYSDIWEPKARANPDLNLQNVIGTTDLETFLARSRSDSPR